MNSDSLQELANLLNLVLSNQMKIMASGQVLMIQQSRLIAALTKADQVALVEEFDSIFQEEKNKLQLAMLAELRMLKGGKPPDAGGGMYGGAG